MSFSQFKILFYNDIKKMYNKSELDGEVIKIDYDNFEIVVSLMEAYEEYESINDYDNLLSSYIMNISDYRDQYMFKLDYTSIYPVLKNNSFGINEKYRFYKTQFALNLNIYLVQDMGKMYKYLSVEDIDNNKDVEETAYQNLSKIANPLIQLSQGIFSYKFANDLKHHFSSYLMKGREYKKN
jgi:hypothetical protein